MTRAAVGAFPARGQTRFWALDGFRGVAAIAVVLRHVDGLFDVGIVLERSYAVDLFFVLSGFVIAHAYEPRLSSGVTARRFLTARIERLYPLYVLGLGLGVATAAGTFLTGKSDWTMSLLLGAAAFGVLWLPFPAATPNGAAPYPLNAPSWSLFFELIANIVYAFVWHALTLVRLVAVVAVSGVALAGSIAVYGTADLGWDWASFLGGFPRVIYSFFGGVLIFRLRNSFPFRVPGWALIVLLLSIFCLPVAWGSLFDGLATLVLFPVLVLAGANVRPGDRLRGLCALSGRLSYPLYVTHVPLIAFAYGVLAVMGLAPRSVPLLGLGVLLGLLFSAWAAERFVDVSARSIKVRLRPAA